MAEVLSRCGGEMGSVTVGLVRLQLASGRREEMVGHRGHADRVERFNLSFLGILGVVVAE